jgi:uncharacterized protein YecT (DUF1311 family)
MVLFPTIAIAVALSNASAAVVPCFDGNTLEMNQCLSERLSRREADLATYVSAARNRIQGEIGQDGVPPTALHGFDTAEAKWSNYRDAQCNAVYEYWSAGTIRGLKSLKCRIILTQQHSHTVWSEWLRYEDDTPPILPEPPPATFP